MPPKRILIPKTLTHLDLFSGIGGFAYAIDQVFYEEKIEHIFVEIDSFCQAVLRKHWPKAEIYGDINNFIQGLTGLTGKEYIKKYELSSETIIQRCSVALRTRNEHCRDCPDLWSNKADNVDGAKKTKCEVSSQSSLWETKPFLSWHKSSGQGAKSIGKSNNSGSSRKKNNMRNLRRQREVQGWTKQNTSTPPRLSEAIKSNVAMSKMSLRMAQKKQSNYARIKYEKPFILTAGVPCQPASQAGKRQGTQDDRWLWPQTFAVIREFKPNWCILENVRGLLTLDGGLVFESLCFTMEELGYSVWPFIIPACAVGAPHRRDRVWIIAYHTGEGLEGAKHKERQDARCNSIASNSSSEGLEGSNRTQNDGCSEENSIAPNPSCGQSGKQTEQEGRKDIGRGNKNAQNSIGERSRGRSENTRQVLELKSPEVKDERSNSESWERDWREVAFATCHDGMDDGLPRQMDGVAISAARHRKERLKACGNAIVPQVAIQILKAIKYADEMRKKVEHY